MIPVYIVMGLLGSGKTSLINVELRERKKLGSTEIISFETGNTEFIKKPLSIEPDDIEEKSTSCSTTDTGLSFYDNAERNMG